MNTDARLTAKLFSACPPDSAQKSRLEDVLSKKYGEGVELVWQEDPAAAGGFRIEIGSEIIDWTAEGRLEQLKEKLVGPSDPRHGEELGAGDLRPRGGQRAHRGGRYCLRGRAGERHLWRDTAV